MNEQEARARLQEILDQLYVKHFHYSEANLAGQDGKPSFVGFHINKMYREFGGTWDDAKANEYINSLEADTL